MSPNTMPVRPLIGDCSIANHLVGAVIFLESDESDFITEQTIVIDGRRVMR